MRLTRAGAMTARRDKGGRALATVLWSPLKLVEGGLRRWPGGWEEVSRDAARRVCLASRGPPGVGGSGRDGSKKAARHHRSWRSRGLVARAARCVRRRRQELEQRRRQVPRDAEVEVRVRQPRHD